MLVLIVNVVQRIAHQLLECIALRHKTPATKRNVIQIVLLVTKPPVHLLYLLQDADLQK